MAKNSKPRKSRRTVPPLADPFRPREQLNAESGLQAFDRGPDYLSDFINYLRELETTATYLRIRIELEFEKVVREHFEEFGVAPLADFDYTLVNLQKAFGTLHQQLPFEAIMYFICDLEMALSQISDSLDAGRRSQRGWNLQLKHRPTGRLGRRTAIDKEAINHQLRRHYKILRRTTQPTTSKEALVEQLLKKYDVDRTRVFEALDKVDEELAMEEHIVRSWRSVPAEKPPELGGVEVTPEMLDAGVIALKQTQELTDPHERALAIFTSMWERSDKSKQTRPNKTK